MAGALQQSLPAHGLRKGYCLAVADDIHDLWADFVDVQPMLANGAVIKMKFIKPNSPMKFLAPLMEAAPEHAPWHAPCTASEGSTRVATGNATQPAKALLLPAIATQPAKGLLLGRLLLGRGWGLQGRSFLEFNVVVLMAASLL